MCNNIAYQHNRALSYLNLCELYLGNSGIILFFGRCKIYNIFLDKLLRTCHSCPNVKHCFELLLFGCPWFCTFLHNIKKIIGELWKLFSYIWIKLKSHFTFHTSLWGCLTLAWVMVNFRSCFSSSHSRELKCSLLSCTQLEHFPKAV